MTVHELEEQSRECVELDTPYEGLDGRGYKFILWHENVWVFWLRLGGIWEPLAPATASAHSERIARPKPIPFTARHTARPGERKATIMAVLHCLKCNRELWFTPTRRRRREFWNLCLCGLRFQPRETGRPKRHHTPDPHATVLDRQRRWRLYRRGAHA